MNCHTRIIDAYANQTEGQLSVFMFLRYFVVRMPENYDIGFVRNEQGTYDSDKRAFRVLADWWGMRSTGSPGSFGQTEFTTKLQQQFEDIERRIRREYALKLTLEQVKKQGFNVVQQTQAADGTVKLLVRRWFDYAHHKWA